MAPYKKNVFIVIPAYNEQEIIHDVIKNINKMNQYTVIVVDDCSTDDTVGASLDAGALVLRHIFNLGQGAALQTGIEFALQQGADYIVTFDADGQHDPDDIPLLITALENNNAEIALGSRFLGNAGGLRLIKKIFLQIATVFTSISTGLVLTDTHNGLRGFTREGAQKIYITQNRMAHASEILSQIGLKKIPYIEVPVTISYSDYSISKGQKMTGAFDIILDIFSDKLFK